MVILETERLILRHFIMDDLDELYRLVYADPMVKDTWSAVTGTADEIKTRFTSKYILPEGVFGFRAIVLKDSGNLIGLMGFQRHEPGEGQDIYYLLSENEPDRTVGFDPNLIEVELTYALGRAYWKKGYATEAGRAMIVYGFEKLGIGRIIQGVLSSNTNSITLMQRLGFRVEKGLQPELVVGVLDNCEVLEELILSDPRFRERIAQARSSLHDRRGISIEELREKYGIEPLTDNSAE